MALNSTPITWVAGSVVTAAQLNQEVRDPIAGIQATYANYSTSWTATTTNPAIGNGTILSQFLQVGKMIDFWIRITMGSTTTFGTGTWQLTLPIAASTATYWLFQGVAHDASAATDFPVSFLTTTTSIIQGKSLPTTAGNAFTGLGAATPLPWAVSDVLVVHGRYETS